MAAGWVQATVIVPVYNGASTLPQLLAGLRGQNLAGLGEVELLFVDNNSTDESAALIEAAALPGARLLHESVQGAAAARNRALAEARGDVIAAIDADCLPTRQWLRELVMPFGDPRLVIAAGGLASYPPRTPAQRFIARYGMNDAGRNVKMEPGFANGRNMAVRRSAAVAVDGWRVDMRRGEDMDFSYRVTTRFECKIDYLPRAMAFHQDRADDEALLEQAFGYGQGLAMMYAHHPDALPWGAIQRLRRARTTFKRRFGVVRQRVTQRLGHSTPEDLEFARYLDRWNGAYWRGFDAERRAMKAGR